MLYGGAAKLEVWEKGRGNIKMGKGNFGRLVEYRLSTVYGGRRGGG